MKRQKHEFNIRGQNLDHRHEIYRYTPLYVTNGHFQWVFQENKAYAYIKKTYQDVPKIVVDKISHPP